MRQRFLRQGTELSACCWQAGVANRTSNPKGFDHSSTAWFLLLRHENPVRGQVQGVMPGLVERLA